MMQFAASRGGIGDDFPNVVIVKLRFYRKKSRFGNWGAAVIVVL
jgi:hypothetical protein